MQACYTTINSVSEFKVAEPVAALKGYTALRGRQRYLVAYGDYDQDGAIPTNAKLLEPQSSSAYSYSVTVGVMVIAVMITISLVL